MPRRTGQPPHTGSGYSPEELADDLGACRSTVGIGSTLIDAYHLRTPRKQFIVVSLDLLIVGYDYVRVALYASTHLLLVPDQQEHTGVRQCGYC